MIQLSAFADEISPDLEEQIRVCKQNDVYVFELRGVAGKNVLDFDTALRNQIKTRLAAEGMAVAVIGSPIGKVKVNDSWDAHFDRFKIAVELAQFFGAKLIRVFSYYPPEGGDIARHRDEVMRRMQAKIDYIRDLPVTMVHENEARIWGETGRRCLDLMTTLNSPKLRSAFDFANFVQAGEDPLTNWPLLKPFSVHIHIKDALKGSRKVVPAGQGDGHIPEILQDLVGSGYSGFLSLEPHLKVAGHSHGETGPELFKTAADALKQICARVGIVLSGPGGA